MSAPPRPRTENRSRTRGPADPVRELMHRHAALCANAVDPLEIAAGLEAQGLTDRVAGRFRHRDVFGLAEELYARVPGPPSTVVRPPQAVPGAAPAQAPRIALHLLPGGICAIAALLARVWGPAVCVVAVPLTLAALLTILRAGPLRAPGRLATGGALWTCWLLGFAVYGERTMTALAGGQERVHAHAQGLFTPASTAALVAITLAPGPAAWCAHRFAVRARAHLAPSRGLKDFAGAVRPLLAGTLGLFLLAQVALLSAAFAAAGAPVTPAALAGPAALGLLLFTARLLTVHGYARVAVAATGTACAAEGIALVAAPFHRLVLDPAAVTAVACGCAALVLGAYALGVLARVSAHTHTHSSHQDLEQ